MRIKRENEKPKILCKSEPMEYSNTYAYSKTISKDGKIEQEVPSCDKKTSQGPRNQRVRGRRSWGGRGDCNNDLAYYRIIWLMIGILAIMEI